MGNTSELPVRVEIGAKAEAKIEITTTVPEKSAGRFVDAITDLVRPFSEARGLRGDQIRLQREEIAIEIAKLARHRLEIENAAVQPVPNKVLVPLLEAASNEEPSDERMKSLWANLLASAASKADVEPRFVGILSELHGKQAIEFERLALNDSEGMSRPLAHLMDRPSLLEPSFVLQGLANLFSGKNRPDIPDIYASIQNWIEGPGCIIVDIIVHRSNESWSLTSDNETAKSELDLEILGSLGLCRKVDQFYRSKLGDDIQFIYYAITELGVRFFFACKNLAPEPLEA